MPASGNNNPLKQNFNWTVQINGDVITSPESKPYQVSPGVTQNLFSGTRSLSLDGTTGLDLTLNPILPGVYRLTWTAGAAPVFRTDRALALSTEVVTVTVNNNATASFLASSSTAPRTSPRFPLATPSGSPAWPPVTRRPPSISSIRVPGSSWPKAPSPRSPTSP